LAALDYCTGKNVVSLILMYGNRRKTCENKVPKMEHEPSGNEVISDLKKYIMI
jgi:hypothetical protein